MSKSKFLTIHTRISDVGIVLFEGDSDPSASGAASQMAAILGLVNTESRCVSKNLITIVETILKKNNLNISDLNFIAAHTGPAPHTTLRVVLATINGIAFTNNIECIGVNGLEALIDENKSEDYITIALLNAYGKEIYYGFMQDVGLVSGSAPVEQFLGDICPLILSDRRSTVPVILSEPEASRRTNVLYAASPRFVGNAAALHKDLILKYFPDAVAAETDIASIETIGRMTFEKYRSVHNIEHEIMPVYLKNL